MAGQVRPWLAKPENDRVPLSALQRRVTNQRNPSGQRRGRNESPMYGCNVPSTHHIVKTWQNRGRPCTDICATTSDGKCSAVPAVRDLPVPVIRDVRSVVRLTGGPAHRLALAANCLGRLTQIRSPRAIHTVDRAFYRWFKSLKDANCKIEARHEFHSEAHICYLHRLG